MNKIPPLPGEEIITLSLREEKDLVNPLTIIKNEIDEEREELPMTVPAVLDNPDKLIVEAQKSLKGQKSYDGMVYSRGLTIKVSPDNVGRALLFMDTLIKLLRVRGHDVVCGSKTYAVIEEMKIEIGCKEKFKKLLLHDERNSSSHQNFFQFSHLYRNCRIL